MRIKFCYILIPVALLYTCKLRAQQQLTEGIIVYEVNFKTSDPAVPGESNYKGMYTITIKGKQVRKEMRMAKSYEDVVVYDGNNNSAFSLKTVSGKKYAIQLSSDEYMKNTKQFEGYTIGDESETKKIAGVSARKAVLSYPDGSTCDMYYTTEWTPPNKWMLDHFPDIKYLPVSFTYTENGVTMHFKAIKIESTPVESSLFRIPADYKIISYSDYVQMGK